METESLDKELCEELSNKNVKSIIISIEAQLNDIPPCGDSKGTHKKNEVRQRLFSDREITERLYGDDTDFIKLKSKDEIIYLNIIKTIQRAIEDYHCYV